MAETLTDPMAGYDDRATLDVKMADGSTRYVGKLSTSEGYEFDPKKEIDPMAGKFFSQVESNPNLSPEAKLRVQTKYLAGLEDIQAQRQKIEGERLRNIMDRQTIETRNQAFAETRRKQEDAARAAENQRIGTETVNGILASGLPPEEQRKQIAAYEVNNAAKIVTDPALKYALDAAKGQIPVPTEPLYSTKDMRDKMEKGVPPEIAMGGNPVEIGYYERFAAAQEKEMSDKLEDRKAAAKEYRSTIIDLAKEPPSFFSEEEAIEAGVSSKDPNLTKYLTPESHQKGRILIGLLKGSAGLAEFEKLSDADKREAIMVVQRDAMLQALQKADTVSDTDEEDVTVDSLLTPKKR